MKDNEILKSLVEYCSSKNVDLDTLNKIAETTSLTAMKVKNRLSVEQLSIYKDVMKEWAEGNPTTREFKGIFRGGK